MKRPSLLAVGLLLCSCGLASAAMVVQGYNPANHDRFYVGADKAFIGDPYNWSGVGVNGFASWATMISPDYFISANHSHPADGSTLTFYYSNDPNGGYETATVDSGQYIGDADVWLGKLSAPVSSNVAKYPVLSLPSLSAYVGLTVDTFGLSNSSIASQNQRLGRNVITVDTAAVFEYNYDAPGLGADESLATSGDSGAGVRGCRRDAGPRRHGLVRQPNHLCRRLLRLRLHRPDQCGHGGRTGDDHFGSGTVYAGHVSPGRNRSLRLEGLAETKVTKNVGRPGQHDAAEVFRLSRPARGGSGLPPCLLCPPVADIAEEGEDLFHCGDSLADFAKTVVTERDHAGGGCCFAEIADRGVGDDGVADLVAHH